MLLVVVCFPTVFLCLINMKSKTFSIHWKLNPSNYFVNLLFTSILCGFCLKTSILVVAFFSISSSQPLLSQISLRRRETREFRTMSQALGIPDSGVLAQSEPISRIDPNEPLDKLLMNKRFRQSFMAFADR